MSERFKPETVVEAAIKYRGMVYKMAEALNCHPSTIYRYRDRYEEVAAAIERETNVVDDTAEMKLAEAIERGEPWAIKFRLKYKGRHRGYGESKHVDHTSGGSSVDDALRRLLPGFDPDDNDDED